MEAYQSVKYDGSYKKKLDEKLLLRSLMDEEVLSAIKDTGKKGVAFDYLTC